jgi:hypothetical protein
LQPPPSDSIHLPLLFSVFSPAAIGFVRASAAPEDQLKAVIGRQGLMQFWDCCGAEQSDAPGCCTGRHTTYDEEEEASVYS